MPIDCWISALNQLDITTKIQFNGIEPENWCFKLVKGESVKKLWSADHFRDEAISKERTWDMTLNVSKRALVSSVCIRNQGRREWQDQGGARRTTSLSAKKKKKDSSVGTVRLRCPCPSRSPEELRSGLRFRWPVPTQKRCFSRFDVKDNAFDAMRYLNDCSILEQGDARGKKSVRKWGWGKIRANKSCKKRYPTLSRWNRSKRRWDT